MYCSSCGSALPTKLTYCNRCGAKVGGANLDDIAKPVEFYPESLVWAVVSVFIGGLGVIIGLMAVMKEVVHFDLSIIWALTLISFLLLLVVEGVFISMLFSSKKTAQRLLGLDRTKENTTRELDEANMLALPEPVPSVTEQTTRAFEPVYNKQKLS